RVGDDVRDVLVGQRVDDLPAAPGTLYHAGRPQHPQMLGDQRLRRAERGDQLVDTAGTAAQLGDDRDAQRCRERPQQLAGCRVRLPGHSTLYTAIATMPARTARRTRTVPRLAPGAVLVRSTPSVATRANRTMAPYHPGAKRPTSTRASAPRNA